MPPVFILWNPMKPQSSTLLPKGENPNPSVWNLRPSTVGPTFPVISPTTPYHLPYDQVTPDNSSYPRRANHFNVNTLTSLDSSAYNAQVSGLWHLNPNTGS